MNPLKQIMGTMNPQNNIMNIISALSSGNPQQMLLNLLKQQNPQAFNQLNSMMSSGTNPNQVLNQMMSNLTPEQKQQFDSLKNQILNK